MAIVVREQKKSTAVYAVNYQDGAQVWERLQGTDAREHARSDARMRKQIKAGTYARKATSAMTVGGYAKEWFAKRTNRTAEGEERLFDNHVRGRCAWFCALKLEDVRMVHTIRLIDDLGKPYEANGVTKTLAPKSIFLIFGTVRTMFRNALAYELILRDPCLLPDGKDGKGKLSKKGKRRAPYTAEEVQQILSCASLAEDERIFCALAFYTGMREGEIAGRRWRDYDPNTDPLGALTVATQYDDQPLKTDNEDGDAPRVIPVHPELAEFLADWHTRGFELVHCRKPTADDFIVPVRTVALDGRRYPWAKGRNHSRSSAYKLFRRALDTAGVKAHSLHSTRHTFITYTRRGKCDPYALEKVTHNAEGKIIDGYTHFDFDPLCEAVSCLSYAAPPPRAPRPIASNVVRLPARKVG